MNHSSTFIMLDLESDNAGSLDFSSLLSRQLSFNGSHLAEQVPPERLARAGLYFTGKGDKVQCFSCGKTLDNWSRGDVPVERHKEVSPKCTFIRCVYPNGSPAQNKEYNEEAERIEYGLRIGEVVDETTYPKVPHMRSEEARLQTFAQWPSSCPMRPSDLARAGFFSLRKDDHVQCFCCAGMIGAWEPEDDAWGEHEKHYPNCLFILGHDVGNIPLQGGSQEEDGGRRAVYMGTFEQRLQSFQGISHPISPERLAQAGFYSTGKGDRVLCFSCRGGLKGWEPEEDPWEEHDPLKKLEQLQREKLCKICMDRDISVVFVPCGHLVACQQCSREVTKCPICCSAITQKVKTFIA
uniref:E3 ubiquitin-protein ligase XIAP n=1 Tax=Periophthalmus magnuspinnatus TaxID=409849 RepID=A0A3B3Z775_9GOBI